MSKENVIAFKLVSVMLLIGTFAVMSAWLPKVYGLIGLAVLIGSVFLATEFTLARNSLVAMADEERAQQKRALAEAHWVRGIGILVDAIERTAESPVRRNEMAELARILPHVKEHHRSLVEDQHLQRLLKPMAKDAQESKELLSAGLIAIENLGWIEAIGPLENLALSGLASRKELNHCLASLQERARAIREYKTLVRPADGDALLVHPTMPNLYEDESILLRPTSGQSQE